MLFLTYCPRAEARSPGPYSRRDGEDFGVVKWGMTRLGELGFN